MKPILHMTMLGLGLAFLAGCASNMDQDYWKKRAMMAEERSQRLESQCHTRTMK